jgi:anti-sigma B factor antagonist
MLHTQWRREGSAFVVDIHGSLKYENMPTLRGTIQEVLAHRPAVVVLNLEGLEFIDSSGVSMLIALHQTMKSKQGILRLCGLGGSFNRFLNTVNLASFFSIFHLESDALGETAC